KALDPDNRRAGTDIKLLGRRAPRRPAFNFRNHSRPHVFRIGLRHRPASQNRINADRLSHPSPSENLLDSIGTEHALVATVGRAASLRTFGTAHPARRHKAQRVRSYTRHGEIFSTLSANEHRLRASAFYRKTAAS